MPRTYKSRNRYCHACKLSERTFRELAKLYCAGFTATEAAKVISRWARSADEKPVSRIAVQLHFQALGLYLLHEFYGHPATAKKEVDMGVGAMLEIFWAVVQGTYDGDKHQARLDAKSGIWHVGFTAYDRSALSLFIVPILVDRHRKVRGFRNSYSAFASHVGYAHLLFANKESKERFGIGLPPPDILRAMQRRSFRKLLSLLEGKPLSVKQPKDYQRKIGDVSNYLSEIGGQRENSSLSFKR